MNINWLSFSAKCDDGCVLRKQLTTHLPHIRVCTIALGDLCRDILPTGILTDSESMQICLYQGNKNHTLDLPEICDITEPRTTLLSFGKSELLAFHIENSVEYFESNFDRSVDIKTHEYFIELCSLVMFNRHKNKSLYCTVEIRRVDCDEPSPRPVSSVTALLHYPAYTINFPASSDDDDDRGRVILLPNSKYRVTVSSCDLPYMRYINSFDRSMKHFDVLLPFSYGGLTRSCIKTIKYKVLSAM